MKESITVRDYRGRRKALILDYGDKVPEGRFKEGPLDPEFTEFISISISAAKEKWRNIKNCSLFPETEKNSLDTILKRGFREAEISLNTEKVFTLIEAVSCIDNYIDTGNKEELEFSYRLLKSLER